MDQNKNSPLDPNDLILNTIIVYCFDLIFPTIEDIYKINIGKKFIFEKEPTIEAYCRLLPYDHKRTLAGESIKLPVLVWGDILLKRTNIELILCMQATRLAIFDIICTKNNDFAALRTNVINEIKKTHHIWMFEFNEYKSGVYFNSFKSDYNDVDTCQTIMVLTFLLLHEIGHLLYNIFIKNCYKINLKSDNDELHFYHESAYSLYIENDNYTPKLSSQRDEWYEEYFADVFSMIYSVRFIGKFSEDHPFVFPFYGLSINSFLMRLNEVYYQKIEVNIPKTHPTLLQRKQFLKEFIFRDENLSKNLTLLTNVDYYKRVDDSHYFIESILKEA